MDLARFLEMTGRLDAAQLRQVAAALGENRRTAGDTVDWWQAVMAVDRAHRAARTTRAGSAASRRASSSVLACAERVGAPANSADIVATARAAGTVAWALAAGPGAGQAALALLRPWLVAMGSAVP